MKRKHISLKTKLAAALLSKCDIPWNDAKQMTADQFLSLYHWDHYPIPHSQGGSDDFWNLEPVLIAPHRKKTAKIDQPQIAKTKRVERKWKEHQTKMQDKVDTSDIPEVGAKWFKKAKIKRPWPKRKFPDWKKGRQG